VTISAPWVHAMALEELAGHLCRPGAHALDVGCGSGVLVAAMARVMAGADEENAQSSTRVVPLDGTVHCDGNGTCGGLTASSGSNSNRNNDNDNDDGDDGGTTRSADNGGGSGVHAGSDTTTARASGGVSRGMHGRGVVVGIERLREICERAVENLAHDGIVPNISSECGDVSDGAGHSASDDDGNAVKAVVVVRHGDGWGGAPDLAPFDAIHVGAAASELPPALVAQLAVGGRMVIPVGERECQSLLRVDKGADGNLTTTELCKVRYVPLVRDVAAPRADGSDTAVDWNERYKKGWAYGKEPSSFLASAAAKHLVGRPPLDILCLFEGQGRNAVHLASLGHRCTVVDASSVGLFKARLLAEQRGVESKLLTFVTADLVRWSPATSHSFDAIVSVFGSVDPPARARLHRVCMSALRPGGLVIVEAFAPQQAEMRGSRAAGPPADLLVSPAMLEAEFAGLEVLVSEVVEERLRDGPFHRGPAALCHFVARKPQLAVAAATAFPANDTAVDRGAVTAASLTRYRAVIDTVFRDQYPLADAAAARLVAASAAAAAVAASASTRGRGAPDDWMLSCASTAVRIACWAATQGGVCRSCWVPPASCYCHTVHQTCAAIMTAAAAAQATAAAAARTAASLPPPPLPLPPPTSSSPGSAADMVSEDLLPRKERNTSGRIRFVVACHPLEFLRSTSSAKLAVQLLQGSASCACDGELLVIGAECHRALLDAAVRSSGPTFVLFPGAAHETLTVEQALASATAQLDTAHCNNTSSADGDKSNDDDGKASQGTSDDDEDAVMTVLVPDGSWECARAVVRALKSRAPDGSELRTVRLDDALVRAHFSPLIDALKPGQGAGRVSTLEAMAIFLSEVADANVVRPGSHAWDVDRTVPTAFMAGLAPLVEHVLSASGRERDPGGGGGDGGSRAAAHPRGLVQEWTEALRAEAVTTSETVLAALPQGLRHCPLCHETLATPLRMPQHLLGRKHASEVAKRALLAHRASGATKRPEFTAAAVAAMLHEHSTSVLAACCAEPPDVANVMILDALAAVGVGRDVDGGSTAASSVGHET
jgi:protein-L-isoaspartate(D-aspartate) O-methyltransferase